jgi:hypothetical protein
MNNNTQHTVTASNLICQKKVGDVLPGTPLRLNVDARTIYVKIGIDWTGAAELRHPNGGRFHLNKNVPVLIDYAHAY